MAFDFILSENDITVDLSMLQDLIGADIPSIKPIIELFLSTMPQTIDKLNQYYELRDWDNLYKTAHFAKSSVSIIKVGKIYEAVVDIELKAWNKKEIDSIKPLINFIALQYAVVERLLKRELQKLL